MERAGIVALKQRLALVRIECAVHVNHLKPLPPTPSYPLAAIHVNLSVRGIIILLAPWLCHRAVDNQSNRCLQDLTPAH